MKIMLNYPCYPFLSGLLLFMSRDLPLAHCTICKQCLQFVFYGLLQALAFLQTFTSFSITALPSD